MAVFGHFVGALFAVGLLTSVYIWLLRKHFPPITAILVANLLSLITATIVAGFGFSRGDAPDFVGGFARYAVPQLVWLLVGLFRANQHAGTPKSATPTRREPSFEEHSNAGADALARRVEPSFVIDVTAAGDNGSGLPPPPPFPSPPPPLSGTSESGSRNFIVRHWRGGFSLGMAYWGISVLTNVVVAILVALIGAAFSLEKGYVPVQIFWALVSIWTLIGVSTIWQVVGTWRAASNHAAKRIAIGKGTGWAIAAKVALAIGVLSAVGQFLSTGAPQIRAIYEIAFNDDPTIPPYSLRVMRNGTEIEIVGGFKYGLTSDFERVLKASPRIRVVHLHSIGGRIGEAKRLFDVVRRAGMSTYVSSSCQSACTLAFAAGKERWIATTGRLGFHSPAFPGMTTSDFAETVADWKSVMVSQGIERAFADRALAVPNSDMWRPTLQELVSARVVTSISDGSQFAISGYGSSVTKESVGEQLAKNISTIGALKERFPGKFVEMRDAFFDGYQTGQPEAVLVASMRAKLVPIIKSLKAKADDAVIIDYARILVEQYGVLASKNVTLCYRYAAFGGAEVNVLPELPQDLIQRELALSDRVIRTASETRRVDEKIVEALWGRVGDALAKRFPADKISLLTSTNVPANQHGDYCVIATAMYQEILRLRPNEAAVLLRNLDEQ